MARDLIFVGTSQEDLRAFPEDVKDEVGYVLWLAQIGERPASVKPLRGFGGASVLEIIENDGDSTYRCVYTVKHPDALYVVHAFQKKSSHGRRTPAHHIDLINQRLKEAARISAERCAQMAKARNS